MYALLLLLRLAHVLTAIFWVGTVFYLTFFLYPAVGEAGPAGSAVMGGVMRRKMPQKMILIALLTVVSGLLLYWINGRGQGSAWYASRPAMVFGLGGVVGIAGWLWAFLRIKPLGDEMSRIGAAIAARGGPPTAEEGQRQAALMGRAVGGTRTLAWIIIAAAALMSVARYLG